MNRTTHTKVFLHNWDSDTPSNRIELDRQIDRYADETNSNIKQVSMVSHYMSSTLTAIVIFEGLSN
jgi:hypothetical protein